MSLQGAAQSWPGLWCSSHAGWSSAASEKSAWRRAVPSLLWDSIVCQTKSVKVSRRPLIFHLYESQTSDPKEVGFYKAFPKLYLTGLKVVVSWWGALENFPNPKPWHACSPAPFWRIWVSGANGNWYLNHLMAPLKNSLKGMQVGVTLCLVCPYAFLFHSWFWLKL